MCVSCGHSTCSFVAAYLETFKLCCFVGFMYFDKLSCINWVGHILRRNCLLKQVIEGEIKGGIEVKGRRGRRRRKLVDDLK